MKNALLNLTKELDSLMENTKIEIQALLDLKEKRQEVLQSEGNSTVSDPTYRSLSNAWHREVSRLHTLALAQNKIDNLIAIHGGNA